MALFKNMSITSKGISLFTKAQAGNPIHFTKMRVGSGNVGTQNPLLLIDLVDGKLDVPISSITPKPEKKTATIVGNVDNTGLLEPLYICEIGIYAQDPDEGEILYGYSNCGEYGDYYAPETQGPYSWQYQIAVAIGNAANVTVELTKLNLDYTVMSTNTSFVVLSGGNQKELNKSIDTKLKTQGESITKNASDIVAIGTDLTNFKEETISQMAESVQRKVSAVKPTKLDDITKGFKQGDIWIYERYVSEKDYDYEVFQCFDNKIGIAKWVQYKEVSKDHVQIYGFEVDETNLNPRTAVTYIGEAIGKTPMRLASGVMGYGDWEDFIKEIASPVIVQAGIEQYTLDYDNYTQKALGGASVLTGVDGDVFTKLTHIHMKYEKTVNGYKWYVASKPFDGSTSLTEQLENGYNQFNNPILVTLQNLYLLLFKDRDSQSALGRGYVDGNTGYANTGGTNSKGFIFGETTGKQQMKFLGIEDFWGNKLQWVDGLVSDANWDLLLGDKTFNDTGAGYTKKATDVSDNLSGYPTKVQGGDAGYVAANTLGSESTGYADYGVLSSGRVTYFGGYHSYGGIAGAFSVRLNFAASHANADYSARLCFKNEDAVYIGAYLGFVEGGKLRSISGKEPTGSITIGNFRTNAKANN